ncbi:MAG: phytanoyl-CoA dioxygenase family protein [Pseudomonadota bacterium]
MSVVGSLFRRFMGRAPTSATEPPASAPGVVLHVSSTAQTTPTSGLIIFDVSPESEIPRSATLRVIGPGDEGTYERRVEALPQPAAFWIAVHGHLLDDGPQTVRFELIAEDGQRLASVPVTVLVSNPGALAATTRASLRRSGAPFAVEACDAGDYDYADEAVRPWHEREPAAVQAHLDGLAARSEATDAEIEVLRHFVEHGFAVLPDVVGADLLDRLNGELDDAAARKVEGYEWGSSQRLHNLHLTYPAIREMWAHPRVLRMLSLIFDARPRPYQSLTYIFGSEQHLHQDTVALTPFPAGYMCGVWTALEDVQPDSGELQVYPGSHRGRRVYLKDVGIPKVAEDYTAFGETIFPIWVDLVSKTPPEVYRPKAGTVLIWHENLMHAGRVRLDKSLSRRSVVCHYFADGAIGYHDASGMPGVMSGPPATA